MGIHFIQKIGGLFNPHSINDTGTDWPEIHTSTSTVSPLSASSEFLFPSVEEGEGEVMKLYDEGYNPLLELEDPIAMRDDFCEVFTDLDDLMLLDGSMSPSIQHLLTPDPSTLEQPKLVRDDETVQEIVILEIPEDVASSLDDEYNVDHSYSTIKSTAKRKYTPPVEEETEVQVEPVVKKSYKYMERRKKNNIASKRSREARKNKFVEMDGRTEELEHANDMLRKKIAQLEILTRKMKEALTERLATSK